MDFNLADLPAVTFRCVYRHFAVVDENGEQPVTTPVEHSAVDTSAYASQHTATSKKNDDDDSLPALRGLSKGFLFFKDGHLLKDKLEMHPFPEHTHFVFVRASVLPSMVKTKLYTVRLCLTDKGDIHTAYCVCPAGLGKVCNHVGAVGYGLADFF